jgi:hypothetical protein
MEIKHLIIVSEEIFQHKITQFVSQSPKHPLRDGNVEIWRHQFCTYLQLFTPTPIKFDSLSEAPSVLHRTLNIRLIILCTPIVFFFHI